MDDRIAFKPYHGVEWLENRGEGEVDHPRHPGMTVFDMNQDGRMDLVAAIAGRLGPVARGPEPRKLSPGPARASRFVQRDSPAAGARPIIRWIRSGAERRIWLRARQPFGRITIANSDAAANATTEGAIGEAYRAAQETVSSRG